MADIGDVVLIHYREKPGFFARIDSIRPDIKKDWFNVQLLILTIPLKTATWTLRQEYIQGAPFTMDGNPVKIEALKPPAVESHNGDTGKGTRKSVPAKKRKDKVVPFRRPGSNRITD